MKLLIIFAVAVVAAAQAAKDPDLMVTFGFSDVKKDKACFFTLPRTLPEARSSGKWFEATRPDGSLMPSLVMMCQSDRTVCLLFDPKFGIVAGLQIGVPESSFVTDAYEIETRWVKWEAPGIDGSEPEIFLTGTQFFVSQDELDSEDWQPDMTRTLNSKGVWVKDLDQNLVLIPTAESDITQTLYKRQNCLQNMGTHYFYNMTTTMPCDKLNPWFALYKEGELVATGWQTNGVLKNKKTLKYWSEAPPTGQLGLSVIIPKAPKCVYDDSNNFGLVSMHVYYISSPWDIRCTSKDSEAPLNFLMQTSVNALFSASGTLEAAQNLFG